MKKLLIILICMMLVAGCSGGNKKSFDGKDRPSSRGIVKVVDGQLCGQDGSPIMLRGISNNGISVSHNLITDEAFHDISHLMGCNLIRLALYTWGMGTAGYCTGGDKASLMKDLCDGVEYARNQDMYAMIDWHILNDGDPNEHIEDAREFFDEVSKKYRDYNNVIYEICNEPNHTDWASVKKYAEVIIPIIRNNDPDSVIIIGTTNWSQDVDVAANDPLNYDNIMYTLHFYSASHRQQLRDKANIAINKGLALFVTEFGITSSSGDLPIDEDEANIWIDFLEDNKISWCMWNFSRAQEASAALNRKELKFKDFTMEDFSRSGLWLIDKIKEKSDSE